MIMSQTVKMQGKLINDALALNATSLHDASAAGINSDVFPAVARGQMQKMLEMLSDLNEALLSDAEVLESRMRNMKEPDEYGRDTETGKLPGRYLGLAKE